MFNIQYKSLRLVPSKSASQELIKLGLMLRDCRFILENGYDAPRKRKSNIEEKWFNKGNKTYNIVIVKVFNHFYNENVFLTL